MNDSPTITPNIPAPVVSFRGLFLEFLVLLVRQEIAKWSLGKRVLDASWCSWLVVEPPFWKIWTSVGMMKFPIYGKKRCSKPPTGSWCFMSWSLCTILQSIPENTSSWSGCQVSYGVLQELVIGKGDAIQTLQRVQILISQPGCAGNPWTKGAEIRWENHHWGTFHCELPCELPKGSGFGWRWFLCCPKWQFNLGIGDLTLELWKTCALII